MFSNPSRRRRRTPTPCSRPPKRGKGKWRPERPARAGTTTTHVGADVPLCPAQQSRAMQACSKYPSPCHPERSRGMNSRLKCNSVFREYLVGGFEAEALSGGVVVAFQEAGEAVCGQRIEVGLSGQVAAQPTNRVFDAALLPRRMGVAEPSLDAKPSAQ